MADCKTVRHFFCAKKTALCFENPNKKRIFAVPFVVETKAKKEFKILKNKHLLK